MGDKLFKKAEAEKIALEEQRRRFANQVKEEPEGGADNQVGGETEDTTGDTNSGKKSGEKKKGVKKTEIVSKLSENKPKIDYFD